MNEKTIEELKHITYALDLMRHRFKSHHAEAEEDKCTSALVIINELIADLEQQQQWNK